jgi:5-methylthioadenosine/S-adenosylhomocysteine deaminase
MKKHFSFPLINTHTHAAMLAFRGMAEDLTLDDWLNDHIWPMEKEKVTPQFVYENAKLAISEMKRNGIRAFADMYFFEDEVARAAEELEMHVLVGEGIIDFSTPSYGTPEEAFEITEKLIEKYRNSKLVSVAVAAHSIYTVSEKNLVKAKDLARKHDSVFHIHLSETKKEFEDCKEKNGLTPVEYAEKLGLLDEKALLAHCVWLTDRDVEILTQAGANISHCPLSNLKLGSGIAPIHKLINAGVNVSLGTDGAASSNRLDIWEAGKIAALLQKGVSYDPTHVPAKSAIKMMTVNGLRALGMNFWNGKTVSEIEKEIDEDMDFNYLYELQVGDINFKP